MRTRIVRAAVAGAVLAGSTALFASAATGTASADTTPVALSADARHPITNFESIDDVLVDGVHQRVLISDPDVGRIVALTYGGTTAAEVTDLPGVDGLLLSADSSVLYAAVAGEHAIVAYAADTLTETARYSLGGVSPSKLAFAGGKLWFSYPGNFASLDLTSSEVAFHTPSSNSSPTYGAPLLAASIAAPNLLAVSDGPGITFGNLYLYDASAGPDSELAHRSLDALTYTNALAFSGDGSQIAAAGVGGFQISSAADLSDAGSAAMYRSVGMDTAANGWLAVATPPTGTAADLHLYPAGSATPTREFDFPIAVYAPSLSGLVWEPGGARLFAITSDYLGQESLWVLNEPTMVATAIQLSAPATATRAASLTVSGTITGTLAAGTALTVTRTDLLSPGGTPLAPVTTTADGTFSVIDKPPAGGTVTYTVAYAGDSDHKPSSARVSVAVSRDTPTLTMNRNGTVNAQGTTVALTAHLGTTYQNRTVEIWADPYGSDQTNRLLKKGVVDSLGNLSVNFRLTRNTTVSAVFGGDPRYAPRTVKATLYTKVSVSTTVASYYKTAPIGSTSYYYFHATTNPRFTTTMTAYPSRKQNLTIDYYSDGAWHSWRSYLLTLDTTGKSTYTLTGTHKTGVRYRIRAAYLSGTSGDSVNYTTYGSYKYFTFTK